MKRPLTTKQLFNMPLAVLTLVLACGFWVAGCTVQEKEIKDPNLTRLTPVKQQSLKDDFSFPSRPPLLSNGKVVFQANCQVCHTASSLNYGKIKNKRPINEYLMLSRGEDKKHDFKKLTREERWEAVFYYRYLAGGATTTIPKKDLEGIYGANCAVCHGKRGYADGPLYTGHGSSHELGMAPYKNAFQPPPANFHDYARFYNRSDDQLVVNVSQGLYPSAMPSWLGRKNKVKGYVFDDAMIRELVKYVRQFSYENDLPDEELPKASGPVAGHYNDGVNKADVEK